MKYIGIFLFLAFFFLPPVSAQETNWYKCLKGRIDKYAVTMHLHKMNDSYAGYYYYDSRQEPIHISGDDTTESGKIRLFAFTRSANGGDEIFSFRNDDTAFEGTWRKDTLSKPLVFSASVLQNADLVPFGLVYYHDTKELKPGMKESPAASFEAAIIWPSGANSTSSFIAKTISEIFDQEKNTIQPSEFFKDTAAKYFREYVEGYKDLPDEEFKERSYSLSSDETNRVMIVYQTPKFLSISHFNYSYAGGAHGNYSFAFFTLDLLNKRKLQLNDVITEAGAKQMPSLLEKYFRKAYNVPAKSKLTDEGLFEDRIESNDNFCITGKGLYFSYAPYEIGPYVMGEIGIFIPFSELQNYLQPGFKPLMQ